MTIRVEREALLMVINTSSLSLTTNTSSPFSSLSYNPCIRDNDDEFVIVDSVPTINKGKNDFFYSDITYTRDDDQASLCTISTTSDFSFYSTSDSSIIVDRRVSFAPQLVTDIWTRPRTVPEDVSTLFYSAQETQKVGLHTVLQQHELIIVVSSLVAMFLPYSLLLWGKPSVWRTGTFSPYNIPYVEIITGSTRLLFFSKSSEVYFIFIFKHIDTCLTLSLSISSSLNT